MNPSEVSSRKNEAATTATAPPSTNPPYDTGSYDKTVAQAVVRALARGILQDACVRSRVPDMNAPEVYDLGYRYDAGGRSEFTVGATDHSAPCVIRARVCAI